MSTQVGAEGLPVISGKHFLQADQPEEFARAVIELLRDADRRRALGRSGRQLVEAQFSWPQVALRFEEKCQEVIASHAC